VVAAEEAVFSQLFEKVSPGRTHNNVGIYVGVLLVCLQCLLVDFLRPHKLRNKYVFAAETGPGGADGERPSSNGGSAYIMCIHIIITYILYLCICMYIYMSSSYVCVAGIPQVYTSAVVVPPPCIWYNEFAYNVGT